MMSKYKTPIQLFVVFEKMQIQLWTSTASNPNFFHVHIPQKWFYSINIYFKKNIFFTNSNLIDSSAVDCSNYKNTDVKLDYFLINNKLIVFYVYYFYYLKIKINLSLIYNFLTKSHFQSIDLVYNNAGWIERETSEMFGINYSFKKDLRKLLLDYSTLENPLLKLYPSEGFFDVFYNFFDNQVTVGEISSVEL